MIRLFTALTPSDSITERLQSVQKEMNGFRWLNPSTYHCTLVYFGDTNVYLYRQIKQQLHNIYFSPFTVEFEGLEVFPNEKNEPHVLVAKAKSEPRLNELQAEMNHTISMFHPNLLMKNRFSPHVTIARLTNPDPNELQKILTEFNNFTFGSLKVNCFALFSSRPTSAGSVYTKLESYQFNAVDQPMPV
jgi:2'-5' RNA ligase